jgi:5,10-methylenetetrahydromethanopterin reductase
MRYQVCYLPNSLEEAIIIAKLVEALGYDAIWIPDQTFNRDPYVLLSAIAHVTERVGIGLGVTTPFSRHPVQIARAIGTLDELSEGRALLGLGAGNKKMFLDKLGIKQKGTASLMRQSVGCIRKLLSGDLTDWNSPELTLDQVQLEFPTRPELPIFVASRSPLMLSVGGEVADGVIAEALFTPGGVEYVRERIKLGADKAGREWESVEHICWQVLDVNDDRDKAVEALKAWAAHIIGASNRDFILRMGINENVAEQIKSAYVDAGVTAAARYVGHDEVDAIAIAGDPDHCRKMVTQISSEGINTITFLVRGSLEDKQRTLKGFADSMMN